MKILLIGLSTRAMAESAVNSGYPVITLDAFGDLDLRAICEGYSLTRDFHIPFHAPALFNASRGLPFDAVAFTSNLENHPGVVKRFSGQKRVLGNSAEVLVHVRRWPDLYASLRQAGFKTPETLYDGDGQRACADRIWLRKPVLSGGGHGISYWSASRPVGRSYLLQEYMPGLPCSASFVANGDTAVVIGLTEQLIGLPEFGGHGFRYCGNLLPLQEGRDNQEIAHQVQEIASLITRKFGLAGVNGMDFILADGQVYITEVNPRYSASMELIERAYGLHVFDLHVRAIEQGDLPDFVLPQSSPFPEQRFYGKAVLFAKENCRAPTNTASWPQRGIRDVPFPGDELSQGKPICTVLAEGPSREACFAALAAQAEELAGELYA